MVRSRTQQVRSIRQIYQFWRRRFQQAQLNQVAASLAFTTILAIVPMISIATILISELSTFINLKLAIQTWITSALIPGDLGEDINAYLDNFSSHTKGLTTFGVVGLLFTAFLTLMTIERAFNQVWRVQYQRPFWFRSIIYLLVTVGGPILLGLSIYITSLALGATHHVKFGFTFHRVLMDSLLPFLLTMLPFIILYKLGPSAKVRWSDAAIGGTLSAIVFEMAKYCFTFFVSKASLYQALYGAFAIGPLFLIWIYLTWWVTLAGAVLTASLPLIRDNHWFTDV